MLVEFSISTFIIFRNHLEMKCEIKEIDGKNSLDDDRYVYVRMRALVSGNYNKLSHHVSLWDSKFILKCCNMCVKILLNYHKIKWKKIYYLLG